MQQDHYTKFKHIKQALQSGIIWANCIAFFETFQVITSSSVRYLGPWDVVGIFVLLLLAYSLLWSSGLVLVAFILKPFIREIEKIESNLCISYLCFSLFIYNLFWIVLKINDEKFYYSVYGFFHFLLLLIAAGLTAAAIFKILQYINQNNYLKNFVAKLTAFILAGLSYMVVYVYLKSITADGNLNPIYAIALIIPFIAVCFLGRYLFKGFMAILKRIKEKKAPAGRKALASIIVFLLISLGASYFGFSKNMGNGSMPHIIFISIDTLRADHLSIYNEIDKETSPNIDKIARDGYAFKKAYSTSSWTLPAHASMFTGQFPSSHQADRRLNQTKHRPVDPLPYSALTLAEILKENGYITAGIIGNPFVSSTFGMNQGFDFFDDHVDLFEDVRYISLKDYSMLFRLFKAVKIIDNNDFDGEQRVPEINRTALEWIERNKDNPNPFFFFLHYNEPHFTYEPPWPYNKNEVGKPLEYYFDIERLNQGQYSLSSYGLKDMITLYDGEINYLDYHLGLLFKKLGRKNLLDNTVIVITSDHGESFNEHEVWQHGNRLYEEQIKVPLIFWYPKLIPAGLMDHTSIVQIIDILPTILDILKIKIPDSIQGRSLLPIFKGKKNTKFNMAFAEIRSDINWKAKNQRFGDGVKTVIFKEWKFISYDDGNEELFNLDTDPLEENNLVAVKSEKASDMRTMMEVWFNAVSQKNEAKEDKIDSGRLEQLRSLGYLK